MVLEAKNIYKVLKKKEVLTNVNMRLYSKNIYAFCGSNGSGKTMLFRVLSGLVRMTKGAISLDDRILHKDFDVLPNLGLVLENVGLYLELTGKENLQYLASFRKIASIEKIEATLNRVGLDPNDKRIYRKYSLGMKQRLSIAQAIMEEPDIIMLDEPTNGLDEEGVSIIRNLILEEKQRGAMILLSSHNREDISLLADKVFYVTSGVVTEARDGD